MSTDQMTADELRAQLAIVMKERDAEAALLQAMGAGGDPNKLVTATDRLRSVQRALGPYYTGTIDGEPGRLSDEAWGALCADARQSSTSVSLVPTTIASGTLALPFGPRSIADMHGGASFDARHLVDAGVVLAIHRVSLGLTEDTMFARRAREATDAGLLYAGYYLPRRGYDPIEQLKAARLAVSRSPVPIRKLAFDWEGDSEELLPTWEQIRIAVAEYQQQTGDAHPIVYGSHAQLGAMSDAEMAQFNALGCVGWYARYLPTPVGLPTVIKVFAWQDACPNDKGCENGMTPIAGNEGADYSRYAGTAEELRAAWPLI